MNITKVGVIGTGVIGKTHLAALHGQPDFQIVGLADTDPAALQKAGAPYPYPRFADAESLFAEGRPDYVVICTPHFSHAPLAMAAMDRGIHALVEKPFAIQASAADAAIQASRRTNCRLAVSFNMRPRALHARLRQLLAENAIGQLTQVTMVATAWFRSMFYYRSSPWRATWRGEGGGILVNQAPHDLDLLIEMAGLPSEVLAEVATVGHAIEVEDSVSAVLKWDNGLRGMLHVNTNEYPGRTMFELAGTRGAIILEPKRLTMSALHGDTREISDHAGDRKARPEMDKTIVWDDPPDQNRYLAMHRNFAAACRGDEQLICPAEDGLKEVELANAILISGIKGRPARLPSARDEFDGLLEELQEAGNLTAVKNRYAK